MGFQILEFNGGQDHVHLLVEYPPALSISNLVNQLKSVSSRLVSKHFGELVKPGCLWSLSYFASSGGGAAIDTLQEYIKEQDRPS